MKSKHLIYIYFLLLIAEVLGEVILDLEQMPFGIWAFKPFLMPVLIYWYYKETKADSASHKIILAALFFSWWGDNFLMPGIFKTDINFLLGLGSFLIAHLMYLAAFLRTNIKARSILKSKPYLVIPFAGFGFGLISFLFKQNLPGFTGVSIPVIIYSAVIILMVIAAIGRYGKVNPTSYKWVLIGALSFMISDTVIALSRFTLMFEDNMSLARVIIMPLYAVGQYLIVKGCALQGFKGEILNRQDANSIITI